MAPNRNSRGNNKRSRGLSKDEQWEVDNYDPSKELPELNLKQLREQVRIKPNTEPKNIKQEKLVNKIRENKVIFISGPAGSGKTFIAMRAALQILLDGRYFEGMDKILLSKPIIEAGDESLGYLPGDEKDKTAPYYSSFYSNIEKIVGPNATKFLKSKFIEEKIIAYERGSTFDNCIAILDEAQNLTVGGLKLFLSRLGENAKMIIMGDEDQIDLPKNKDSGLEDAFKRFEGVDGVTFHRFTEDDIVRSKILIDLMKCYKKK